MTQYSGKLIRKTPLTPTQQSASGVWTVDDAAVAVRNNAWPVAGVPDPISRSVRFRSSASAYFNRTPASAGNQRTWTWSGWVKLGSLSNGLLFSAGTSTSNVDLLYFNTSTNLFYFNSYFSGAYQFNVNSSAVYRDPSAWYHVVFALDTTQATSTNRAKLYVNGVQQTLSAGSGGFGSQNLQLLTNSTVEHDIGRYVTYTSYFDGYMTEVNFIDGQALTPSSFGTTDAFTGAWVPMAYTGTYGTNGFYLNFKDNTSTTTLGYDYSGNSNNWTANNISLTAGVTYDSMLDVPTPWIGYNTDGGVSVTRGNYATLNPLKNAATMVDGNLKVTASASTWQGSVGTIGVSSGKWYWEITKIGGAYSMIGIANGSVSTSEQFGTPSNSWTYFSTGDKYGNGTYTSYGASYTDGDVIGVALDMDAGTLTFYKNNTTQGVAYTSLSGELFPFVSNYTSGVGAQANFGQRPFSYTPPTGFKALCTTNLPTPTITNGASYMAATLYTGNGANGRAISNGANNTTGTTFQPDFSWLKDRSATFDNRLENSIVTGYLLASNSTAAEASNFGAFSLTSTGISVSASINDNNTGDNYVAWQWKAGGSAVSNTAGSITSSVSAGTTQGFSVVTYTGNGTGGATVGHGLGVAPSMVIVKSRSATTSWFVAHASLTTNANLLLNTTDRAYTNSEVGGFGSGVIGGLTSSTFQCVAGAVSPSNVANINTSSATYVAYCFAAVAGYSAFGSYTGNGSTDGPFVYCGFRPRYILRKRTDSTGGWLAQDSSRPGYNATTTYSSVLYPNTSDAETIYNEIDILSNGFKIRANDAFGNASGGTYIYAAFAENPFKYSNAR